MRKIRYVIKLNVGFFYQEGPNVHWTEDMSRATRFDFITIALAKAIELGYANEEFTVESV